MRLLARLPGLLFLAALLAAPAPSYASCAQDSGPQGSPVVFVGTAEENRSGFTRFEVDEVWAGPDLADEVWVLSGQEQSPWPLNIWQGAGSSIDADFSTGESYVVGATADFSTNDCRVAAASADLGDLRPDDPRSPVSDGATGADPPIGPWASGSIVIGVVLLLWGLRLNSRRRRIMRTGPATTG